MIEKPFFNKLHRFVRQLKFTVQEVIRSECRRRLF